MSEYQYYEFLALDRPLSGQQREELREMSSRAEITATQFTNEYHWGDFRGDPAAMMREYFDAHLYFANWGTRRLMFRVPVEAVDTGTARQYVHGETAATLDETGEHLVIDLYSAREPGDDDWEETHDLGAMVGARSALISGDLRLLYLAWLFAVQWGEIPDDAVEPPVPAGLADLSAPLRAVVEFLEIDEDLIDVAALASPEQAEENPGEISEWIATLPSPEKDTLLARVAAGEGGRVQALLRRRFRDSAPGHPATASASARTVEELCALADDRETERLEAAVEREKAERERREAEKAAAYAKHLDDLSAREASAWLRVDTLIDTKNQRDYDRAVTMLRTLRDLAERDGTLDAFATRFGDLRRQHQRKPSLMERFDAAGLPGTAE